MSITMPARTLRQGALCGLLCMTILTSGCAGLSSKPLADLPGDDAQAASCAPAQAPATRESVAAPQPSSSPQATAAQELQGQLSIKLHAFDKTPAKGLSLGFFFSGNAQAGRLDLMTLMGSQLAQVDWTPESVWLTDDKGRRRYESMEALSAAALGEALPLQALVSWMQGRPSPDWPSTPVDKPSGFTQLGWHIDLSTLGSKQLTASRPGNALQRGAFLKVYLDR